MKAPHVFLVTVTRTRTLPVIAHTIGEARAHAREFCDEALEHAPATVSVDSQVQVASAQVPRAVRLSSFIMFTDAAFKFFHERGFHLGTAKSLRGVLAALRSFKR